MSGPPPHPVIPRPLASALQRFDHLLVAFSGGVDSTLLLAAAVLTLGPERVAALTALSPTLPRAEREECQRLVTLLGVSWHPRTSCELDNPDFAANGPDRCYHCKSGLFDLCAAWIAGQTAPRAWQVAYGANRDDLGDHRPGMEAARQRGIHAPLLEAGMDKAAIRALSRALNLPTADKPAFACLSSRFPTFTPITREHLSRVERAEEVLRQGGLRLFRVRFHGAAARVELGAEELARLENDPPLREELLRGIREAGFREVLIDPRGYRTGGANPPHPTPQRE